MIRNCVSVKENERGGEVRCVGIALKHEDFFRTENSEITHHFRGKL